MKRLIVSLYRYIALLSPHIEVKLRQLYWKNVSKLKKFKPFGTKRKINPLNENQLDFNSVIRCLIDEGVGEGALLVVHSSYDALECTGLSPDEIINQLLDLVGKTGTLAMPAIRKYKGGPKAENILSLNTDELVCTYKVKKTVVTSGILPYSMMQRYDAVISHHPLSSMVAIGALAKEMMENNLNGDNPSPHGPNSSWKFCLDHDAIVIGLGVDLEHYNTMVHVAEEAFGDWRWPNEEWFRLRKFDVIDENNNSRRVVVSERKPQWGLLHLAEMRLNRDLAKANIVKRINLKDDIIICVEKSRELISFLKSKNKNGYPYFK
ncbi:MAG: hypothetical protein BGO34_10235 [Bacteroidia bacterium 44-10]|jgi:aminoglycoside 3-N-acetyltransferase|nr:MAG: hypothetical protein BGO34_10235 [Bacteroidia bacterium 44-10]